MNPSILLGDVAPYASLQPLVRAALPLWASESSSEDDEQPATGDEAVNSEQLRGPGFGATPPASVPRSRS